MEKRDDESISTSMIRLREQFDDFFGIDLRTLGLVRIVAAMSVLWLLFSFLPDLETFFTDQGIYPQDHRRDTNTNPFVYSLHMLRGELWWQYFLFVLHGVSVTMMLVGYKTRLSSLMTWILTVSLFQRTPIILHRADALQCMLLLWGALTPWGARFSIDAAMNTASEVPRRITSVATAGLLLQMPLVYYFSFVHKFNDPTWIPDFTAVFYTLRPAHATALGELLVAHQPIALTQIATALTLVVEGVAPWLMFFPLLVLVSRRQRRLWLSRLRIVAILALTCLQLGLLLTVAVGLFPVVSILGILPAIPSSIWERWGRRERTERARKLVVYCHPDREFAAKLAAVVREFLLPRSVQIVPGNREDLDVEWSESVLWVVRDPEGGLSRDYRAIRVLLKYSPWAFFLEPVVRMCQRIGELVDVCLRRHHRIAARLCAPLKFRSKSVRNGVVSTGVASLLLAVVVADNLDRVYNDLTDEWLIPHQVRDVQYGIFAQQGWTMFISPERSSFYFVMKGILEGGEEIDVYQGGPVVPDTGGELTWDAPEHARSSAYYANYRWRLYFVGFRSHFGHSDRAVYGDYVCRRWNETAGERNRLVTLQIYEVIETRDRLKSPAGSGVEALMLWKQECGSGGEPGE